MYIKFINKGKIKGDFTYNEKYEIVDFNGNIEEWSKPYSLRIKVKDNNGDVKNYWTRDEKNIWFCPVSHSEEDIKNIFRIEYEEKIKQYMEKFFNRK
jgi:hypothetical protein